MNDEGETLSEHWLVTSQFSFENIALTRPAARAGAAAPTFKYLACGVCDRGPVGIVFLDKPSEFFVAHARVKYA